MRFDSGNLNKDIRPEVREVMDVTGRYLTDPFISELEKIDVLSGLITTYIEYSLPDDRGFRNNWVDGLFRMVAHKLDQYIDVECTVCQKTTRTIKERAEHVVICHECAGYKKKNKR